MQVLSEKEVDIVAAGMGSRGYRNPNPDPCDNAVMGGFVGGGIAGITGGPWGIVFGAFGGAIAGYMATCKPTTTYYRQ